MSTTRPPVFDERYSAPVEASRRGAHRARPNPVTALLPVVAGVAVVLLVVAGAYSLFRPTGSSSSGTTAAAPTATAPAATPSADASAGAGADEPTPDPSQDAEPSAGASDGASGGGSVDKSVEVTVLNSIRATGLAKRVAADLEDAGWTIGETGNSSQRNLRTTRVYYAAAGDAATAKAIAKDLTFGSAVKSAANAGDGITVVLGEDARS